MIRALAPKIPDFLRDAGRSRSPIEKNSRLMPALIQNAWREQSSSSRQALLSGRRPRSASIVSDPAAKSRAKALARRDGLRTQRAGRIIGCSLDRVGIAGHQDADLLPTKSVRIIDPRDFTGASPEGQHRSIGMFENPGDFMRRRMGIERRRLCRGGRGRDKRSPAEAENRQLLIARHKHLSIRHDRHDIGVGGQRWAMLRPARNNSNGSVPLEGVAAKA